jgi:5-hydroxyisourate hydrolase-like protein (transthyretin family)
MDLTMSTSRYFAVVLVALALAFGFTAVRALAEETAKATGAVKGTVLGADGKPAASVKIQLVRPIEKGKQKAEAKAEKPAKGDKPAPVATGTTDSEGKFSLEKIEAGKYVVRAQLKGVGNARETVEVKAGETATVELTLKAKAPK